MTNRHIAAGVAALLLSACSTFTAPPKDHFYTLDDAMPPATTVKGIPRHRIAVGPVHVPEMVDRPEMVVQQGPNQVRLLEEHRWAQPLKTGIARALARDLDQRLEEDQVTPAEDYASRNADYRITVDVDRFDAIPGDSVAVDAVWTISDSGGKPLKTGRSTARMRVSGNTYAAIVTAFGQSLSAIGSDIGNAMRSQNAFSSR